MQDRFKFRIFYANIMIYPNSYENIESIFECLKQQIMWDTEINTDFKFNHIANNLVFMQSTGLRDKNGKLIYEGDVVKIFFKSLNQESINIVEWDNTSARFIFEKFGQISMYNYAETWEVIGNRYETPELLKECEDE